MTNVRDYEKVKTVFGAAEDMETNERATTDKVVEWTFYHGGIPTAAYFIADKVLTLIEKKTGFKISAKKRADFGKSFSDILRKHNGNLSAAEADVVQMIQKEFNVSKQQATEDFKTISEEISKEKVALIRNNERLNDILKEIRESDAVKTEREAFEKAKGTEESAKLAVGDAEIDLDTKRKALNKAENDWLRGPKGEKFVKNLTDGDVKNYYITVRKKLLSDPNFDAMAQIRKDVSPGPILNQMESELKADLASEYSKVQTAETALKTAETNLQTAEKNRETAKTNFDDKVAAEADTHPDVKKIKKEQMGSSYERASASRENAFRDELKAIFKDEGLDKWERRAKLKELCQKYGLSDRDYDVLRQAAWEERKETRLKIIDAFDSDDIRLFEVRGGTKGLRGTRTVLNYTVKGLAALGALGIVVGAYTYGRDELKLRDEAVGEITSLAEDPADAEKYFTETAEQDYHDVLTWIERNLPEDAKEDRAFIQKMRSMIDYPERYEAKGQLEFRKALQQTFETHYNEIENSFNSQSQTFNVSTTGNDTTAASEEGNGTTTEEGNDTTAASEEGNGTTTDDAPPTKYSDLLGNTQTSSKPNVRRGLEQFKVPEDETTTTQMFDRGSRNT